MFNKKRWMIIGVAAVLLAVWYFSSSGDKSEFELVTVKRMDLSDKVSVTGRVRSSEQVSLAFEKSGRVSGIYARVADVVASGAKLASLENADLLAKVDEAEANLQAVTAKFNELRRGTRPEELAIQEAKVKNAEAALLDAKRNLVNVLEDSLTKSDDAVRNKTDQVFSNPRTASPSLNLFSIDASIKSSVETARAALEGIFSAWRADYSNLSVASDLLEEVFEAKQRLGSVKNFLDDIASIINTLTVSSNLSQTLIDTYKSNVSTARTNVNTAISNLLTSEEKLSSANSSLLLANEELLLDKAGSAPESVAAQSAIVAQAEAGVRSAYAELAKTILRSPISGIVTKQDAKVGEIVSVNTSLVSIISTGRYEIEAQIPEADIARVQIGRGASVTLDAYGNDIVFNASVVMVDPAETIIDGVATYKTTLQFTDEDVRIKSGMTANVDITGLEKKDVLAVPQRAVFARAGHRFVQILSAGAPQDIEISAGLRAEGYIEVLSGLKEGDEVIVQ